MKYVLAPVARPPGSFTPLLPMQHAFTSLGAHIPCYPKHLRICDAVEGFIPALDLSRIELTGIRGQHPQPLLLMGAYTELEA